MKLKNNNGSIMILVIIIMALILTFIPIVTFQNITQIKSTMKNQDTLEYKYIAEAGVEKTIAEVCKQIEDILNNYKEDTKYKIEIPEGFYVLNDNIFCIVEEVKEDVLIDIDEENSSLLKINNMGIEIISTATDNEEKEYKIKSKVNIKSSFINNKYNVDYEILTYEKI